VVFEDVTPTAYLAEKAFNMNTSMIRRSQSCFLRHSAGSGTRWGASAVEFSLVAIPIFILIFGCIELGRGMMAMQSLEEAARSGCRAAIVRNATASDVDFEVSKMMSATGISTFDTQIQPSNLDLVPQWDPVTVTVSAEVSAFSWVPVPEFLAGRRLTASCVLPREAAIKVE